MLKAASSILVLTFVLPLFLAGCGGRGLTGDAAGPEGEYAHVMTEGYSLLYGLLADERRVDGILVLKSASEPTVELIKDIARFASASHERVGGWEAALEAEGVRLDRAGLPAVEASARSAISNTTARELLLGDDFELRLLLTQSEALRYLGALADDLAGRERDAQRAELLRSMSNHADDLRTLVLARLTVVQDKPQ